MSDLFSNLMTITQSHTEEIEVKSAKPESLLKDFENGPNEKRVKDGIQIYQQALSQIIKAKEGKELVKDVLNLDNKMVETFYSYAYEFFTKGKYFEAFKIFRLLVILDISNYRFLFGLAECLKHLDFNYMAQQFYNLAAGMESTNPVPYLCAAESAQDIGDDFKNLVYLEQCLVVSKDQPKYRGIHHKALSLYEAMLVKIRSQLKS